jgi:[acyl-carrier-protein] S-malonyltransferase
VNEFEKFIMKAIVFPGQGAQYQGMGKSFYDNSTKAAAIFNAIDEYCGLKISEICFAGKDEDLKKTSFQQLTILAVSLVAYELFKEKNIKVDFLSGLSLGEYTCLYAAHVLCLKDLVCLVKERAAAMQEASEQNPSCMFAVIGIDIPILSEMAKENNFYLSNFNAPGQVVISLRKGDKENVRSILEAKGAKVIELEVGGGFHSPFMQPASNRLLGVVNRLNFNHAAIPIVANFNAQAFSDKNEIKNNLIKQLTCAVLWKDCVEFMVNKGVDIFFEIGPSKVLRGLIRKIAPAVKVINIEKKEDLDSIAQ